MNRLTDGIPNLPGALCAQVDPDIWFPEQGGSTRTPKQICSSCAVQTECLTFALKHQVEFGIWGGMSARERRKLKKAA